MGGGGVRKIKLLLEREIMPVSWGGKGGMPAIVRGEKNRYTSLNPAAEQKKGSRGYVDSSLKVPGGRLGSNVNKGRPYICTSIRSVNKRATE